MVVNVGPVLRIRWILKCLSADTDFDVRTDRASLQKNKQRCSHLFRGAFDASKLEPPAAQATVLGVTVLVNIYTVGNGS